MVSSPPSASIPIKASLYKTELCKRFQESGDCRYGVKCQFAHGLHELRNLFRHPKYKTIQCKSYLASGTCPYGTRCRFVHENVSTGDTTIDELLFLTESKESLSSNEPENEERVWYQNTPENERCRMGYQMWRTAKSNQVFFTSQSPNIINNGSGASSQNVLPEESTNSHLFMRECRHLETLDPFMNWSEMNAALELNSESKEYRHHYQSWRKCSPTSSSFLTHNPMDVKNDTIDDAANALLIPKDE